MTIKQKQSVLAFFECYDGIIDGDWGPLSASGTGKLQRKLGIPDDDIFGPQTEEAARKAIGEGNDLTEEPEDVVSEKENTTKTFWDEIEYFSREEFRCKCGGLYCNGFPAEPSEQTVRWADEIRKRLNVPIGVNSGLRCETWNRLQKDASPNSKHKTGHACDLGAPKGITPEKMAQVAEDVIGNTGGIGIYPWGIHIDSRPVKARWNG